MNRKYRGLTKEGKWVYGYYAKRCYAIGSTGPDMVTSVIIDTDSLIPEEVDPKTVGQSTGLSDLNSQEIYAGDIVKTGKHTRPQIVFWDKDGASFRVGYEGEKTQFDKTHPMMFANLWEILGDIHTTPDLLEKEK